MFNQGVMALPNKWGTEHKRHKRTQKAQIKRDHGSFCASCVPLCASCVLFPILLGKSRDVVMRLYSRASDYRPAATGISDTLSSPSGRSGCMANVNAAPTNISNIEPTNGQVQWPVLSTIYPNTTGETIAASAEPVFIMPLAVPEYLGAMSIGIAHIGPIVNSAQKKPALSASATSLMLSVKRIGIRETQQSTIITATRFRRAMLRFLVFSNSLSLTMPPSMSPTTPEKKTPEANRAELWRSRWYSFLKKDGIQLRNSHSVQP